MFHDLVLIFFASNNTDWTFFLMNQKFWDYPTILNSKLKNSSEKLNQEGISVSQISTDMLRSS